MLLIAFIVLFSFHADVLYGFKCMNRRMMPSSKVSMCAVTDEYLGKLNAGKELAITIDGRASCVAAKDIAEGEVIFSLPIGECFDVEKASKALSWMGSKALKACSISSCWGMPPPTSSVPCPV